MGLPTRGVALVSMNWCIQAHIVPRLAVDEGRRIVN